MPLSAHVSRTLLTVGEDVEQLDVSHTSSDNYLEKHLSVFEKVYAYTHHTV